jgi:hypothetical protein
MTINLARRISPQYTLRIRRVVIDRRGLHAHMLIYHKHDLFDYFTVNLSRVDERRDLAARLQAIRPEGSATVEELDVLVLLQDIIEYPDGEICQHPGGNVPVYTTQALCWRGGEPERFDQVAAVPQEITA